MTDIVPAQSKFDTSRLFANDWRGIEPFTKVEPSEARALLLEMPMGCPLSELIWLTYLQTSAMSAEDFRIFGVREAMASWATQVFLIENEV